MSFISSKVDICCVIITSTDNLETANIITTYLIENQLAACVQMDEIISSFKWEGRFCQSKEFRLTIKTLSNNYNEIERAIKKYHNYKLPQIIKFDITSGSDDYLSWIKDTLK